jgi:spore maturation protein CgeB
MNILFIGGLHYYGNSQAGHTPEYTDLAGSLADMGHSVTFIDYDRPALIDRTEKAARELRPDLILYNPANNEMDWQRFGALKSPKAIILSDDNWRRDYGLHAAQFADYVLTTCDDAPGVYGAKAVPFMWGVRTNRYHSLPTADREHDLMFLGMKHSNRELMYVTLENAGIKPYVAGMHWGRDLDGDKIPQLLNTAKIGLNTTTVSVGGMRQFKARLFEVPACGAMLLTEYVAGLERYYTDGVDAVFWQSIDDLVNKAFYYLTHPNARRAIANAGMARTFQEHSYDKRWKPLLERL